MTKSTLYSLGHCKQGHEVAAPDDVYENSVTGVIRCRQCTLDAANARHRRKDKRTDLLATGSSQAEATQSRPGVQKEQNQ